MIEPIHVIGHLNPDTDAIASAVGYAWLLKTRDGRNALPARAGAVNPQTAWVLKTVGMEAPHYLADASPHFERIARTLPPILPGRPLREAWAVISASRSAAPIVDADGKPIGMVTGNSVFQFFTRQMEERVDLDHVSVSQILAVPCQEAIDTTVLKFQASTRVKDGRNKVVHDPHEDFFVTDDHGTYFGMCRSSDVLNPPRMQIILVDHNEAGQAIGALEEADLIEVLDHHRLGNPPTRTPIPFTVDPVGSTSTLVSERIAEAGLQPPVPIAGLLLAGLMSDTLILKSPTTTPRDQKAAERLADWAGLGKENGLPFATFQEFGEAMLSAGSGLAVREVDDILNSDLKVYEGGGIKVGLAQVEVTTWQELGPRLPELSAGLESLCKANGFGIGVLMVTNVVRGESRLVLAGAGVERLNDLPYTRRPDGTLHAPDVVSRKKQLLPAILGLLE